jgi:hypothetical protein
LKREKIFNNRTNPACFILRAVRSVLIIKTMEQVFVFIYAKGKEIKALNIEESKRLDSELKSNGWKHTRILDACVWIQYLHNDCEDVDLFDEVKSLSKCIS